MHRQSPRRSAGAERSIHRSPKKWLVPRFPSAKSTVASRQLADEAPRHARETGGVSARLTTLQKVVIALNLTLTVELSPANRWTNRLPSRDRTAVIATP